jgi:KaiC/GvpD/RAD55 family RecA-like ATPase/CheY-like chemotaxis protein/HPt (histidine-containing phosphotransfer) domain-containing protein
MSDASQLMPTGIPGLDQLLEGGIVRGNSLLIEGPPGSGKSTLGVRILYEGVTRYHEPGLLVTFEEFPRQVYAEAFNYGIDLHALEEASMLRVIWTPPSRVLESFRGKSDLVEKIVKEIGVRRLLIDSITHFKRVSSDEPKLREILSGILTNLKIAGVNALLVKELERQDKETISFEEYLVDASLRLHNKSEGAHGENTRYLEVRKTRGHGHVSGLHPFQLDTGGFRIFPRLRAKDVRKILPSSRPASRERVTFGVKGLDAMLCGGLLPGSQAVVSGYAGCGKTVLSSHFLDRGLKSGGQGIILSLKDDAEAIMAGAESLGMDWRPAVVSGQLRVLHFHPLGISIEEVVDQLIYEVCRVRPDRFICDSVDGLAQVAGSHDSLRQHVLVMTDILLAAGATSLFIQDARRMGGESDDDLLWLAHLAACSIKFSMAEVEGSLRRFVTIVKHAGSDHTKELREFHIDDHGLHVQRSGAGLSGILTGQAQRALRNLSNDVLPTLGSVDGTLQRIAASNMASRVLLDDVREARQQVALIDAQLREYFGGVDIAEHVAAAPAARDTRLSAVRILLAEDNFTNQQVALGILKKLGLRADAVANGAEAVKALETLPYDLVLMDVQMPEMDGYEATQQIRNPQSAVTNHGIPIIAMTAHAMQGDRERCLEAGMNDYVTKPIAPQALAEALDKWLPKEEGELRNARNDQRDGGATDVSIVESQAPIFDKAGMMARLMEDEDLARTVAEGFLEDIPRQIEALRGYLEAGDAPGAERQAHAIKGASANVGGEALCAAAFDMEKAAKAGDLYAAGGHMAELDAQFDRLKEAMIKDL